MVLILLLILTFSSNKLEGMALYAVGIYFIDSIPKEQTILKGDYHIVRGYDNIYEKFRCLGAGVCKIDI